MRALVWSARPSPEAVDRAVKDVFDVVNFMLLRS